MKSLLLLVAISMSFSLFAADYKVVCRGGRLATYTLQFPRDTGSYTIEDYDFVYGFSRSPVRAQYPYQDMPEGSCAWLDRPFNQNEKPELVIRNAPFIGRLKVNAKTKQIMIYEPGLDVSTPNYDLYIKTFKLYLNKAGDAGQFLYFRARAMPGDDQRLLITKLGW